MSVATKKKVLFIAAKLGLHLNGSVDSPQDLITVINFYISPFCTTDLKRANPVFQF